MLRVKLTPRSSMNKIVGFENDVLKVKVTSAPVDGLANQDLIKLFSKQLKVAQKRIEIVSGTTSRLKEVKFHGMTRGDLVPLLGT